MGTIIVVAGLVLYFGCLVLLCGVLSADELKKPKEPKKYQPANEKPTADFDEFDQEFLNEQRIRWGKVSYFERWRMLFTTSGHGSE